MINNKLAEDECNDNLSAKILSGSNLLQNLK